MATLKDVERLRVLLQYLWECPVPACDGLPHTNFPHKHARASQVVPETSAGGSYIHAWITGRGFGKTRSAAEFVKKRMMADPGHRATVIAQTFGHGRDLCMEGESGLIACLPDGYVRNYNRSLGELTLRNGSQLKIFGSHTKDDAESIRGSQSHTVWAEELAYWRHGQLAWNNAMFANRLGQDPRVVVTATPRATTLMRWIQAEHKKNPQFVHIQGGSTFENQSNLATPFLEHLVRTYQNTRLGAQELEGLMLDDIEGALLSRDLIRAHKEGDPLPPFVRIVVAVDPPGGHRIHANAECGIVAVGLTVDGFLFVLADRSGHYTPEQWAQKTIDLYDELEADCIVAETNFGGAMVQSTLRAYSKHPAFKMVTASRGKMLRAEPVVNLYEQQRVFHVAGLKELETQWVTWVPPGKTETDEHGIETPIPTSAFSPDRVDAEVWAVTELALQPVRTRATMTYHAPRSLVRGY